MTVLALALAAAATLSSARAQGGNAATGLVISDVPQGHEARTTIEGCAVPVQLEYRPAQLAAHYRDGCRRPIRDKLVTMMEMLSPLIERGAGEGQAGPVQLVVFAGRIVQTFPDLAADLVTTAAASSGWDEDVTRRSATAANAAVVQLLTRTDSGNAIRTASAPDGYRVSGIAVEKVLTARPQRLPFALPPHVVSANSDRSLPFDAMLWISLRRE